MAKSLRDSLSGKGLRVSHGECLEIVARQFGFADWNTLSPKLTDAHPSHDALSCSFCGKSQDKVKRLIEGGCANRGGSGCVFICEECIQFCAEVYADGAAPVLRHES
jgi:hypothetical protein